MTGAGLSRRVARLGYAASPSFPSASSLARLPAVAQNFPFSNSQKLWPRNLVVSRSVHDNKASHVVVGTVLPPKQKKQKTGETSLPPFSFPNVTPARISSSLSKSSPTMRRFLQPPPSALHPPPRLAALAPSSVVSAGGQCPINAVPGCLDLRTEFDFPFLRSRRSMSFPRCRRLPGSRQMPLPADVGQLQTAKYQYSCRSSLQA